jgi:hypothetical protein
LKLPLKGARKPPCKYTPYDAVLEVVAAGKALVFAVQLLVP